MNLFELTGQYLALMEMMEDPDVDPKTLEDTMAAAEGELEDKADAYAAIRTQLLGQVEILENEIERLRRRKGGIEGNIKRLMSSLEEAMRATGKTKFKTATHSFGIAKNPPRCVIDSVADVPREFLMMQEPKVDTAGILKALKAGAVYDFAHMEQGESLRIR